MAFKILFGHVMVILSTVLCQSLAQEGECDLGITDGPDMSNFTLAATGYQLEAAAKDEITMEDEEAYDDDFDVNEEDTQISTGELRRLQSQTPGAKSGQVSYPSLSRSSISRGKRQTSAAPSYLTFWPVVIRDCPERWRWGCPMRRTNLGCFRNGPNEVCCPLWPNPIRTGYCKCHNCVSLKPRKAECGTCRRKFRSARFWARCRRFNPNSSWFVRQMTKAVAYRCCCARQNGQCI